MDKENEKLLSSMRILSYKVLVNELRNGNIKAAKTILQLTHGLHKGVNLKQPSESEFQRKVKELSNKSAEDIIAEINRKLHEI